jgi:riboflavin synthase
LEFVLAEELASYLVHKGSVSVDGVSLTISFLAADRFEVALIPHTLTVTTLGNLRPGDRVNLEVDIIGKYVARMLEMRELLPAGGLDGGAATAR